MDMAITKISSKGQVVIPVDLRGDLKENDKLVIIKAGKQFILKKVDDFEENVAQDLEFAKRTEDAYKRFEKGKFTEMDFDEFIDEMKQW